MLRKLFSGSLILSAMLALSGCNLVVMNPSGYIAARQRDLIVTSTILMLLIIVPVMALTVFFAWKYRQSNKDAEYRPEWNHSTRLEVVIWSAPLAIIIALGAITWVNTHTLDPYRPLEQISATQAVTPQHRPLTVEVVALNWKWLFFYPDLGIAAVNELAAPIDTPINFKITSSDLMNSFYIPALAGQIYAMAGMQTQLHAVINKPGVYDGISANYSGAGFSDMNFKFHGLSDADFKAWVDRVKSSGDDLSVTSYQALAEPSEKAPVHYYKSAAPNLYHDILNRCVDHSHICMDQMMSPKPGHDMQANEHPGGQHADMTHNMHMDMAKAGPASADPAAKAP